MRDELKRWRDNPVITSWEDFDLILAKMVQSHIAMDVMQMIDFLALKVKELETENTIDR